jgi:hypothetical protein
MPQQRRDASLTVLRFSSFTFGTSTILQVVLYIDVSIWEFMERSTVHDMCTGTYHTSK